MFLNERVGVCLVLWNNWFWENWF